MQYTSRLFVKFSNHDRWKNVLTAYKITAHNTNYNLLHLVNNLQLSFDYFSNGVRGSEKELWLEIGASMDEDDLQELCEMFTEVMGDEGFVLAETINISVDTYSFCLFCFGDKIHSFIVNNSRHFDIKIKDAEKWLGKHINDLSSDEKAVLRNAIDAFYDGPLCSKEEYSIESDCSFPEIVERMDEFLDRFGGLRNALESDYYNAFVELGVVPKLEMNSSRWHLELSLIDDEGANKTLREYEEDFNCELEEFREDYILFIAECDELLRWLKTKKEKEDYKKLLALIREYVENLKYEFILIDDKKYYMDASLWDGVINH